MHSLVCHGVSRETGKETNEETKELRQLQAQVKENVEKTCCRVNQVGTPML